MILKNCNIHIITMMALTFLTVSVMAQTVFSPYSNFGLGNMSNARNSTIKSLGKSSTAYRDFTVINFDNPASYTEFDTLSFVLDASVEVNSLSLRTSIAQTSNTYGGLGNLQIGFPITKKLKASVGLIPLSNVGYDISTYSSDTLTGKKKYNFEANGGVNNVYLGLGYKIGGLSIGANVSYLFGTINKNNTLLFPDSSYYYDIKILNQTYVHSFYVNVGLQYYKKLSNDYYLCIGIAYSPKLKLTSNEYLASYTFIKNNNIEVVKDTIKISENNGKNIIMPQKIGAGIMFKKLNRYKILVDFQWHEWSKYRSYEMTDNQLNNSFIINTGFEYSPRSSSVSSYFKWVKYRFGVYYEKTPLRINNIQINQYGATFGLGLPIIRSASTINLTLDVGNRGTKSNNLIQETYLNLTIGFSLYDTWFYRIKYK